MYNLIINPISGKRVSIYSKSGKRIIKNYLSLIGGSHRIPQIKIGIVSIGSGEHRDIVDEYSINLANHIFYKHYENADTDWPTLFNVYNDSKEINKEEHNIIGQTININNVIGQMDIKNCNIVVLSIDNETVAHMLSKPIQQIHKIVPKALLFLALGEKSIDSTSPEEKFNFLIESTPEIKTLYDNGQLLKINVNFEQKDNTILETIIGEYLKQKQSPREGFFEKLFNLFR